MINKNKIFCYHKAKKRGWFRIFGIGIAYKHISYGLLFSQRIGKTFYFRIGNYYFYFLKYSKYL